MVIFSASSHTRSLRQWCCSSDSLKNCFCYPFLMSTSCWFILLFLSCLSCALPCTLFAPPLDEDDDDDVMMSGQKPVARHCRRNSATDFRSNAICVGVMYGRWNSGHFASVKARSVLQRRGPSRRLPRRPRSAEVSPLPTSHLCFITATKASEAGS